MKVRLGWLYHPRLHVLLVAAALLTWQGEALSWAVSFARGGPASGTRPALRCPPGCVICHRIDPEARRALDRQLIRMGAMDGDSDGPRPEGPAAR